MDLVIGIVGTIVTIIGIIVGLPPLIQYVKDKFNNENNFSITFKSKTVGEKVITYIWNFPIENSNQDSWAIKESQVLLGNLENAKKNPGLGIAMLSVEFAQKFFGDYANDRIESCINWGIVRTQKTKPYFVQVKLTNPITTEMKYVPDFRHTVALGIILSRTNKHPSHLEEYLKYVIESQQINGGWSAGQGITVSELFSCLYAIELLMLNKDNPIVKVNLDNIIQKAIDWLIGEQSENNLWKSGVFNDYYWDPFFASTWVLNRLIPFKLEEYNIIWHKIVIQTSLSMLSKVQTINWSKIDDLERFRIEARIVSAFHKGIYFNYYSNTVLEQVVSFIGQWQARTKHTMNEIKYEDFDLATALFIAEPLLSFEPIIKIKNKIIAQQLTAAHIQCGSSGLRFSAVLKNICSRLIGQCF